MHVIGHRLITLKDKINDVASHLKHLCFETMSYETMSFHALLLGYS